MQIYAGANQNSDGDYPAIVLTLSPFVQDAWQEDTAMPMSFDTDNGLEDRIRNVVGIAAATPPYNQDEYRGGSIEIEILTGLREGEDHYSPLRLYDYVLVEYPYRELPDELVNRIASLVNTGVSFVEMDAVVGAYA